MPLEYGAYKLNGMYEIWITIRTQSGDVMHKVRGGINNLIRARKLVREFNQEIEANLESRISREELEPRARAFDCILRPR